MDVAADATLDAAVCVFNIDVEPSTVPLPAPAVVVVFAKDGGRLLANTGDGSMTLTKFEGKTPTRL